MNDKDAEITTDDLLLEQRQKFIDRLKYLMGSCDVHGSECIPSILEQVREKLTALDTLEEKFILHEAMTGCLTGDCPHGDAHECANDLGARLIAEMAANTDLRPEVSNAEIENEIREPWDASTEQYAKKLKEARQKARHLDGVLARHIKERQASYGNEIDLDL